MSRDNPETGGGSTEMPPGKSGQSVNIQDEIRLEQPTHSLPMLQDPEIVIGLVGAIGTQLQQAGLILGALLKNYNYSGVLVRISELFKLDPKYKNDQSLKSAQEYYNVAISQGNQIRNELRTNDALAQLAIYSIASERENHRKNHGTRLAYIIHSLKTPEEIDALRSVYGNLFYCVAIHAHEDVRRSRLEAKCAERMKPEEAEGAKKVAQALLDKDEYEIQPYGQKVRDTFVKADYYVGSDDTGKLATQLERFLDLVFDVPFISPTKGEVAIAHAFTAGLRSADLSRQVGAAIVNRDGRVLTTGCNEVPRAGGGQYWADDPDDTRDFKLGRDLNDIKKKETIIELVMQIEDLLRTDLQGNALGFFNKELKLRLKGTRIDSLLEFSRVVHAEMATMNSSALDGFSIRDADLYCTTFPCHLCARQIINTGIRNVFYIEPYPKSLTKELFSDSVEINPRLDDPVLLAIRLDGAMPANRKVAFIPFTGVAPRRYAALFSNGKRKSSDGNVLIFHKTKARPRQAPITDAYRYTESEIGNRMKTVIKEWQSTIQLFPAD